MAVGDTTVGQRVPDDTDPGGYQPGDYGRWEGEWYCRCPYPTPDDDYGPRMQGRLGQHDVTEHEDGTITVSPSILVQTTWGPDRTPHEWHGYLERGTWREV